MRRSPGSWFLLAVGVIVLLASAAIGVLLFSPWGRDWMRERINAGVSSQMMGRLEVGSIERVALPHVSARDIKIFAPDGKAAIDVESAEIDFDLWALLTGNFVWRRAEIARGIVRITEDDQGRINMEETFRARPSASGQAEPPSSSSEEGDFDLRTMVTSDMVLLIDGGTLPTLRLVDLHGIMRVQVMPKGDVQLRFDDYRGTFEEGLPTGRLKFHDVAGHVKTQHQRLLRFTGRGLSEGERVAFKLDIFTEPKSRVKIDAFFPELSAASVSALGVAAWSTLSPTLELNVRHGK